MIALEFCCGWQFHLHCCTIHHLFLNYLARRQTNKNLFTHAEFRLFLRISYDCHCILSIQLGIVRCSAGSMKSASGQGREPLFGSTTEPLIQGPVRLGASLVTYYPSNDRDAMTAYGVAIHLFVIFELVILNFILQHVFSIPLSQWVQKHWAIPQSIARNYRNVTVDPGRLSTR